MNQKNNHIRKHFHDFLDYLKGKLSGQDKNKLEKEAQKDPFLEDALEGLTSLSPKEATEDMEDLKLRLHRKVHGTARFSFYRIAAAVAAVIVMSGLFFFLLTGRLDFTQKQVAQSESVESADTQTVVQESLQETYESSLDEVSREKETIPPPVVPPGELPEVAMTSEEIPGEKEKPEIKSGQLDTEELVAELEEAEDIIIENVEEYAAEEQEDQFVTVRIAQPEEQYAYEKAGDGIPSRVKKILTTEDEPVLTFEEEYNVIRGVVISSEDDLPLQGAIISIKGYPAGTITNTEGQFELPVQDNNLILVADFIGMDTKEVPVTDETEYKIILEPSVQSLDEIVMVGNGLKSKRSRTGAIPEVDVTDKDEKSSYQSPYPIPDKRSFRDYIKDNITFPETDTSISRAVVVLNFIVGLDNRPKHITVLESPGGPFSNEAIMLLMNGPDWQPAELDGQQVEQESRIRIVFKRNEQ